MRLLPEDAIIRDQWRSVIVLAVTCLALGVAGFAAPVAQDPAYHDFADQRRLAGIPNFWNVVSNLPFLAAGIWGMLAASKAGRNLAYIATIFSAGLVLLCFGSGWYHLAPENAALVWDRLPMTVSFMAFFTFTLTIVYGQAVGRASMLPLLVVGIGSVIYWDVTETAGQGDLRLYALVQFLPGILILLFLCLYSGCFKGRRSLWLAMGAYVLAKLLEWQDEAIWGLGNLISGHTLKHLAAALGAYYGLLAMFAQSSGNNVSIAGKET
jgi:hypothetical protein